MSAPVDKAAAVRAAMARFPAEFGLRAFPGERFRISEGASYLRDAWDASSLMLYTERLAEDGEWKDFAKGSEAELRREVVRLPTEEK